VGLSGGLCTCQLAESNCYRLLEIYGILESINSLKDTESVHYETLASDYERLVKVICEDHVAAAKSNILDEHLRLKLVGEIEGECKEILDYRMAAERWHLEIDSRAKDRLVSFGEKLSCRFVATLLRDRVSYLRFLSAWLYLQCCAGS
jgi:aspartate kinase